MSGTRARVRRGRRLESAARAAGGIRPPRTWRHQHTHFRSALDDPWYGLLLRLWASIHCISFDFFTARGLLAVPMPITCGSVSSPIGRGSDSLPVRIRLFGEPTYLADSMQFQLEYLLRSHRKGVFYIMPSFRGERPDSRHLNQFVHAEAEIEGTREDVMDLVEEYLRTLASGLLRRFGEELAQVEGFSRSRVEALVRGRRPLLRLAHDEAVRLVSRRAGTLRRAAGAGRVLTAAGEREVLRRTGVPCWIVDPPAMAVPFYQAVCADGTHARAADLLMGIGETVGCGQRHENDRQVRRSLMQHRVPAAEYAWYLRLKREYPMTTTGFGMGVERFLAWLLGHDDIRDMSLLPRVRGVASNP